MLIAHGVLCLIVAGILLAVHVTDTTTGRMVEVYYNPQTGERDYREPGSQN